MNTITIKTDLNINGAFIGAGVHEVLNFGNGDFIYARNNEGCVKIFTKEIK